VTVQNPLVTFVLFSFNQERYVREAVQGALAQTYTPLQIILSDDASTDNTFKIIEDLLREYRGPHAVLLNRNQSRRGIGGHVNRIMELAAGDIIVAAAADDISDADRVEAIVCAFHAAPDKVFSVWSAARFIDETGQLLQRRFPRPRRNFTDRSIVRNVSPVIGATHAWRREVFDVFGPLLPQVVFEDNAISFRSHLLGRIAFLDKKLVSYRTHDQNITNFKSVADLRKLYMEAARRVTWALIGIEQRKEDLDRAIRSERAVRRNFQLLRRELQRMQRKFEQRLKIYQRFPSMQLIDMWAGCKDVEIAKVLARAMLYRHAKL